MLNNYCIAVNKVRCNYNVHDKQLTKQHQLFYNGCVIHLSGASFICWILSSLLPIAVSISFDISDCVHRALPQSG